MLTAEDQIIWRKLRLRSEHMEVLYEQMKITIRKVFGLPLGRWI